MVQDNHLQEFSFRISCHAVVTVANVRDWFRNRLQILIENGSCCFQGVNFDKYPYELTDEGQSCNMNVYSFAGGEEITGKVVIGVVNDVSVERLNSLLQNPNDEFNLLEISEINNY